MAGPRLDLDWEEGVFRGLLSLWKRVTPAADATAPEAAHLADQRARLQPLAQLVAAEPVRVLPARGVGGVRGRDLLLPTSLALAPDAAANERLLVLRTVVSAAMRRVSRSAAVRPAASPLESLRIAAQAIEWLTRSFPRFGELHAEAARCELAARPGIERFRGRERALEEARREALRGGRPWERPTLHRELARAAARGPRSGEIMVWGGLLPELGDASVAPDADHGARSPDAQDANEIEAPAIDELRRVTLDPRKQEEAVLLHTFEKVETLDSHRGGARDTDGADDLEAHAEALREVDLGDLLRSHDPVHAVMRADLQLGSDAPEVRDDPAAPRGLPYDEWDFRRRAYRPGWCRVFPSRATRSDPAWAREVRTRRAGLVRALQRRLEIHRAGRSPQSRQLDGDDIDLDALVAARATLRAGHDTGDRLYVRHPKRRRDFVTTVLLDVSLSSDSWVEDRRVLDVARDAVFVLGEVADRLGDRLQILAFSSETRHRCQVWEVKGWRDPWGEACARLGGLAPRGYTRIGPALRHAADRLVAEPAERRLLLLVSDGKPTDYDRYEGRYGIADVRQALREAECRGVHTHALAVDAMARDHLPPMFGPGAWSVLPHPDELPALLSTVYGRLTAR